MKAHELQQNQLFFKSQMDNEVIYVKLSDNYDTDNTLLSVSIQPFAYLCKKQWFAYSQDQVTEALNPFSLVIPVNRE